MYNNRCMNLRSFDNKCVRITTVDGEVFEGVVSYLGREYVYHEYGKDEEALNLTPILFGKSEIALIESLEEVEGPFGHYSEKYGLLERKCLHWGSDMIEEILECEDDIQILRMLECLKDNLEEIALRAVPGQAPWRLGNGVTEEEDDEDKQGPIYLGEMERALDELIKYNNNEKIVREAKKLKAALIKKE